MMSKSTATIVKEWNNNGVTFMVKHVRLFPVEDIPEQYRDHEDDPMYDDILHGHHCGYATLPGMLPDEEVLDRIDVHGGITYRAQNANGTYTIGFDCARYGDTLEDWPIERVAAECERMAAQVNAPAGGE